MTYKQAFDELAAKMDAMEETINLALKLKNQHGYLPDQYKHLERFFNESPWRKDKAVVRKIKKAARIAAKNGENLLKEEKIKHIKNINSDYINNERIQHESKEVASKIIFSDDYGELWPFKDVLSIVIKNDKNAITAIIKGKEYALNGIANMRFGYEFVIDAGVQEKGKSIGMLIKLGQSLRGKNA